MPTLFVFGAFLFSFFTAHARENRYELNSKVEVEINTVGPYNNPTERYMYYKKLPFCKPSNTGTKTKRVGSNFAGDRAVTSGYEILFRQQSESKDLCGQTLTQNEIKQFRDAVKKDYTFDFFVDGLLVDGFVGEMIHVHHDYQEHTHDDTEYFLFTHWNFNIHWNGHHVVACHLQTDRSKRLPLEFGEDIEVQFTYSVSWTENTAVSYDNRLEYHNRNLIRDQSLEIHWLSIINSFVLVILLVAFLALILTRILHKDYARYQSAEDDEEDDIDDSGWKQVHGDVFRPPENPLLFAACIGTGTQLLVLTVGVLILSLAGTFYPGNRGAVLTAVILLYCITAGIAGHVSGRLYTQLGGKSWATNSIVTAGIFAGPMLVVFSFVNTVAVYYSSTAALPFITILGIIFLWAAVTFPLTVYCAYRQRNIPAKLDVPCKCNFAKREIPQVPCFRQATVQVLLSGVLPFTAIYIELHYIFAAVFGHRVYTLYGILCLAFLMLVIVTAAITVSLTYFQLTVEDWRWWWRSAFSGGSTGLFIFAYALFYFNYRSPMRGVLQGCFFFGYMIVVSYAFWLMLGAVGFWSAFSFISHIYSQVKID